MSCLKKHLHIILPLLILVCAVISSVLIYHGRTEQYSDWRPVSGYVVQVRELRHFKVRVTYTYMVKGVDYTGSDLYHDDPDYELPPAGSSVTVWYDPAAPEMSSYHKPSPGLDPYGPFFMGLPLCVIAYFAVKRRELPDVPRHL